MVSVQGTDGGLHNIARTQRTRLQTTWTSPPEHGRFLLGNEDVYTFLGCCYHGHICLPFRDITTIWRDTLAEKYERTMAKFEQITCAGYWLEVVWECQFDRDILAHYPELKQHPIVQHCLLIRRDEMYGGEPKPWLSTMRYEREMILYYDVISLYLYTCKYFKFRIWHSRIHVSDACQDIEATLCLEGLIKCTILPPKRLYHPVLHLRYNNKLLFFLCKTCSD